MDLAEHSGFTNWGDDESNWITTNQIKSDQYYYDYRDRRNH